VKIIRDFLIITRAWSFNITFICVTLGMVLAGRQRKISLPLYGATLLGAILIQAAANTLNDYFDFIHKVDTPQAPTALYRPHPIFTRLLTPQKPLKLSLALFTTAAVLGITLTLFASSWLGFLLPSGLILAVFYTATPKALKYRALGEATVFLCFGPLLTEGAYSIQRGTLSLEVLLISLPVGFGVALILLANNLRDRAFDAQSGIQTLATLLQQKDVLKLNFFLSLLPYALVLFYVLKGILPPISGLVFCALPFSVRLTKSFFQRVPVNADTQQSQATFLFGLLLILSLITPSCIKS
jgi:1,4-dihydroxy-2-naphthoate octaprenyltransferase